LVPAKGLFVQGCWIVSGDDLALSLEPAIPEARGRNFGSEHYLDLARRFGRVQLK
jgi:hypothetical protein